MGPSGAGDRTCYPGTALGQELNRDALMPRPTQPQPHRPGHSCVFLQPRRVARPSADRWRSGLEAVGTRRGPAPAFSALTHPGEQQLGASPGRGALETVPTTQQDSPSSVPPAGPCGEGPRGRVVGGGWAPAVCALVSGVLGVHGAHTVHGVWRFRQGPRRYTDSARGPSSQKSSWNGVSVPSSFSVPAFQTPNQDFPVALSLVGISPTQGPM